MCKKSHQEKEVDPDLKEFLSSAKEAMAEHRKKQYEEDSKDEDP